MYLLLEKKINFVMRLQCNANNAVKRFIDSKDTDITIDFYSPYSSLKELRNRGIKINKRIPIRVCMVKVLLDCWIQEKQKC
ncbi:hypothetical protein EZS27_030656 [termite gut metagenome]|uniref:Uncharacterized protein n=1 Tax=termite gut metagenome TaxID=433724 RepID=A0A5J4QEJ3_9ZZZZ